MQKIISQIPELQLYLQRVPPCQHNQAVRHLIKLGIEATRSYCYKENQLADSNAFHQELSKIKYDIEELNHMVKSQFQHQGHSYHTGHQVPEQTGAFQTQNVVNDQNAGNKTPGKISREEKKKKENCWVQKPVKDLPAAGTCLSENTVSFNPFTKRKPFVSRHHLDDTAARQALEFPASSFVEYKAKIKRNSQDYKKHVYQEEINKEELIKIKGDKGDSEEHVERTRRERAVSDYTKAESKIKSLINKDRIRHMQRQRQTQFQRGFDQYEYSDDGQMEESSVREDTERQTRERQTYPKFFQGNTYSQHAQSSFKGSNQPSSQKSARNRTSSKKQFSRSKNEISGKLQRSLGEEIRIEPRSQPSSKTQSHQKYIVHEQLSGINRNIDYDAEDEDVISNSSSFSQFSINGSRKKEVGKISRRSEKEQY